MSGTLKPLQRRRPKGSDEEMAKHLPDPPGQPDPQARRIIDTIHAYLDSGRDPVDICAGLRHVYHAAELAWDESVDQAKTSIDPDTGRPHTYLEIQEATGDALGTLQGRIRAHQSRTREAS